MRILVLLALILNGCDEPQPNERRVRSYKTVVAKEAPSEARMDWMSKDIRRVPITIHYLIYDDGTKEEVPVEQWAVAKIGDRKLR
jgi:hypothetical protein